MHYLKSKADLKAVKLLKIHLFNNTTPDADTIRAGMAALVHFCNINNVEFMDIGPNGNETFQPRGVMLSLADDALAGGSPYGLNRRDYNQIKYTGYDYYYFNVYGHVENPNAKNILKTLGSAVDYVNQEDALAGIKAQLKNK